MYKKIHLACGDVYLSGYENVDVIGTIKNWDSSSGYGTTVDEYYDHPFGDNKEVIVDRKIDMLTGWDYPKESIEEVLMINTLEHFTKIEAQGLVADIYESLIKGGKFIFDFSDLQRSVNEYDGEFMIRLIYGSYKHAHCIHKWGYTRKTITELLGNKWGKIEFRDTVKHIYYPTIGVIATK